MNPIKELFKKLFPEKAAEIDAVVIEETKPLPVKPAVNEQEAEIAALRDKLSTLEASLLKATQLLEAEQKTRTETIAQTQAQKIETELEAAVKAGKITPEQKTIWAERMSSNYQITSAVLGELKGTTVAPEQKTEKKEFVPTGDAVYDTIMRTANFG